MILIDPGGREMSVATPGEYKNCNLDECSRREEDYCLPKALPVISW